MAFALREENALLSGDHVMAWSTSVIAPPQGNMADYFSSLRKLLDRGEETYWPGHGPAKRNPKPFVKAFITHRRMREAAILNSVASGNRLIGEIVANVYRDLDPRFFGAASMSTLAHLIHLVEQEKIVTDGAPGLQSRYREKA